MSGVNFAVVCQSVMVFGDVDIKLNVYRFGFEIKEYATGFRSVLVWTCDVVYRKRNMKFEGIGE